MGVMFIEARFCFHSLLLGIAESTITKKFVFAFCFRLCGSPQVDKKLLGIPVASMPSRFPKHPPFLIQFGYEHGLDQALIGFQVVGSPVCIVPEPWNSEEVCWFLSSGNVPSLLTDAIAK
ncbi:hypothetical protein TWF730_003966 [Orbilia blumenaviensis]|uniref:Uncharacterized protein n=1 Tax=Orbilia blumenaviensis TaxID=1796055 RepID=A0AAV9U3M0_9PEZI